MDERIAIYFTVGIDLYQINAIKKSDFCPKVPNMGTKDESIKGQTVLAKVRAGSSYQIHFVQVGQKELEKISLLSRKLSFSMTFFQKNTIPYKISI